MTSKSLESANTQRRVVASFRNTSSHPCTLIGYPGAGLVTPAGGVLINVSRRPAAAGHHLTLDPSRRRHRRRTGLCDRHLYRKLVPALGQLGRHPAQRLRIAPA
ncbi:DUF4232 domain-containing protein [Mycobacterium sp.]|uniref:DUF4232 domain-containing protein n=1 Tax=Mycobacterium sp. TaxID=1785 RepID=UPI0033412468